MRKVEGMKVDTQEFRVWIIVSLRPQKIMTLTTFTNLMLSLTDQTFLMNM